VYKCTILLENSQSELLSVTVKHGFSALIEGEGKKFLFDVGPDGTILTNSLLLDKSLVDIDAVILSHAHYDHAGGFRTFATQYSVPLLYTGPNFFSPKWAQNGEIFTYLGSGFGREYLKEKDITHTIVKGCMEIAPDLFLVSGFFRTYAYETIPERFCNGDAPDCKKDDFSDEICLIAKHPDSLTLLSGCAHPGILNMISTCNTLFSQKVTRVIGGAHLSKENEQRIDKTAKELEAKEIKETFFCHCSGNAITKKLTQDKKITAYAIGCGDMVSL
jgi:7,8-dihydropterin-6-yl-methyl-4-(beta-D-ribofuranosyl)aminobenzene 5'-phosphate synthase